MFSGALPFEVEGEILGHLDDERSRLPTRQISRRMGRHGIWCTEEFLLKMRQRPIEKWEVVESRKRNNRPLFVLVINYYVYTSNIFTQILTRGLDELPTPVLGSEQNLYFIDSGTMTIIRRINLDNNTGDHSTILQGDVNSARMEIESVKDAIDRIPLAKMDDRRINYWWDPWTVREVMRRRLEGCKYDEPILSHYFPGQIYVSRARDMTLINDVNYTMFKAGLALVEGNVSINGMLENGFNNTAKVFNERTDGDPEWEE